MDCPFCHPRTQAILAENDHFYALRDIHPISKGHCLIVSRRHVRDFFALEPAEAAALQQLSRELRSRLDQELRPDGYKLLMNCGAAARQSVFHFHLHMIPRYTGDRRDFRRLVSSLREVL